MCQPADMSVVQQEKKAQHDINRSTEIKTTKKIAA